MEIPKINSVSTTPVNFTLPYRIGSMDQAKPVPIPEGMPIRKRVAKEFGIEILDSDVKFFSPELLVIEEELKEYKKRKNREKHLIGVKQIVKNKKHRIDVRNVLDVSAGGAYDAENKRVYIFDTAKLEEIPEILTHEIGHAVNHFNVEFNKFMDFIKDNGYNMTEFRKYFIPGNRMYQFGTAKVNIPKDRWQDMIERFSMNSLKHNSDVFGEIILDLDHKKKYPWDENPLEKFAWVYEWYVNKPEEFLKFAEKAAKSGDPSWLSDYEFLKSEVFGEIGDNN